MKHFHVLLCNYFRFHSLSWFSCCYHGHVLFWFYFSPIFLTLHVWFCAFWFPLSSTSHEKNFPKRFTLHLNNQSAASCRWKMIHFSSRCVSRWNLSRNKEILWWILKCWFVFKCWWFWNFKLEGKFVRKINERKINLWHKKKKTSRHVNKLLSFVSIALIINLIYFQTHITKGY